MSNFIAFVVVGLGTFTCVLRQKSSKKFYHIIYNKNSFFLPRTNNVTTFNGSLVVIFIIALVVFVVHYNLLNFALYNDKEVAYCIMVLFSLQFSGIQSKLIMIDVNLFLSIPMCVTRKRGISFLLK